MVERKLKSRKRRKRKKEFEKMSETDKINVDSIIARLLEVRGSRPGKAVQLTEAEIRGLCLKV